MSLLKMDKLASTPTPPGTNSLRLYFGNDGILRSIDENGVVTQYAPSDSLDAFLQYSASATTATTSTTVGAPLVLGTDRGSVPGALLTKVNTTDFRTNFNGFVQVYFTMNPFPSTNDRGYRGFITRNGTALDWTEAYGWGKNVQPRSSGVTGCFILPCSVNDIFQFRIASNEGDNTTVNAEQATCSIKVYKIV
jgi:hypothetical protein